MVVIDIERVVQLRQLIAHLKLGQAVLQERAAAMMVQHRGLGRARTDSLNSIPPDIMQKSSELWGQPLFRD